MENTSCDNNLLSTASSEHCRIMNWHDYAFKEQMIKNEISVLSYKSACDLNEYFRFNTIKIKVCFDYIL